MLSQSLAAAGAAALRHANCHTNRFGRRATRRRAVRLLPQHQHHPRAKLPLVAEIDIAARAGYQGIEPWVSEIDQHVAAGGTLGDLRKRIGRLGLTVVSVIGFAEWIVDDEPAARRIGQAKRIMDMTAQIGGLHAAPPAGVSDKTGWI